MKRNLFWLCLFIFIYTSCDKEDLSDIDYFVFGTAYGECINNCATFFMIKNEKIYADDMNFYTGIMIFQNVPLPHNKYLQAKKLVDEFPPYLLNNPDKTFGCPDCADQGGIHIEIKKNGSVKSWHIDSVVANQPEQIRSYISELLTTIGLII